MIQYSCGILFFFVLSGLNAQNSWDKVFPGVGTFSSPRVADLNGDGVGDVILGAGREEFKACDSAVVALDGKTGALLWRVSAKDQIFGSAIFKDLDADGHPDVVIAGRIAEMVAISGFTGKVLWRFDPGVERNHYKKAGWWNFYHPQWIPDQDKDGVEDLLASNGGDVTIEPYNPDRPVGYLVVVSGRTGKMISRAPMPDGKETYMSITVCPTPDAKDQEILFGTGGETIGGNLYVGYLSEVMKGDLSQAKLLDTSRHRGYIGPAARADINGDAVTDIIVNFVNGKLMAFDGRTHQKIWQVKRPGTETYSSIAAGEFNDTPGLDFFVSFAMGSWPKLDWSTQFMADGKTGIIQFIDSLGFYQNSTAVAIDWDNDGKDEILFSVNFQEVRDYFQKFFYNMLVLIDFQTGEIVQVGDVFPGHNLSSTPWVGDLDNDGFIDILHCHGNNLRHTYTFDGIRVHRIATQVSLKKPVKWGAYQGSKYNGVY